MLTWRLWRALRSPDEDDPLFERMQSQSIELPGKRYLRPFTPIYHALAFFIPVIAVLIAPLALLVASNVLGALIAFNIMSAINRERNHHTYDLLALTPIGLGAVNWLIAAACTQRLNAIERLSQFRTLAIITLILLGFYLLRGGLLATVAVGALIIALNFDAIQTLIIGCLSGMLAQEFGDVPFVALAIFVFIQVITIYLPVTAVGILLFDILRRSQGARLDTDSLTIVIVLALLFALREVVIRLLWRELERRLL
ncbi:MAG: hypothetical protein ABI700_17130 [Chloroflexota bacterium]